jgi:hypothetical protein
MYVDTREQLDKMLILDEDVMLRRLGNIDFQIRERGEYNPFFIMEIDFLKRGKKVFQKYVEKVKESICPVYENMRKSGVLDTSEKVYFFLIGYLMALDTHRAIAVGVAAIITKQGLHSLCSK